MGELPKESTVVTNFMVVDCPLMEKLEDLKALKVVMSIYHLTMKFLTLESIGYAKGCQYDSSERLQRKRGDRHV